jgi:PAS domain-containing protein
MRMVTTDGAVFWARLDAAAARDEAGLPVCRVALSDNTERRRAEEALRESEKQFHAITADRAFFEMILSNIVGNVIACFDPAGRAGSRWTGGRLGRNFS